MLQRVFYTKTSILRAFHTQGEKNCNKGLQDTVGPTFQGKLNYKT